MRNLIALVAGMMVLLAHIPYFIDIVRRKTKPNIVSWFTWTLLILIGTIAAFVDHQPRTAFLTVGDTLANIVVLALGARYGIAKFMWFDGVCQLGAVLGIALWLLLNSPTVAIVAAVIIDLIGSIPTVMHSWQNPSEETWQTFAIIAFASLLTLSTISNITLSSLCYPVYIFFYQ